MTDDVIRSPHFCIEYMNRVILANLFYRKHTYGYKKFCSHGNSLLSSPHPLDFNMLLIFSSKSIKQGHELELIHLYACWVTHMMHHEQYQNATPKVARKAFNIGEVWNLVCCHGNKTDKLILWSTFSRILLKRIKHF